MSATTEFNSLLDDAIADHLTDWNDMPNEDADLLAFARFKASNYSEAEETLIETIISNKQLIECAKSKDWIEFGRIIEANLKDEYSDMQTLIDDRIALFGEPEKPSFNRFARG